MFRSSLPLALVLSSAVSSSLHAAGPIGDAHVYKNIDGETLKLYVNKPSDWKATDQRPAILFFHGGGWCGGRPGPFTEQSKHLAKLGMVVVQVQYRLLAGKEKANDPPEICVNDARDAMRWVRGRAKELGIDPNRIGTAGGSAGGHLAAYLGTVDDTSDEKVSSRSNAMVLFNPVYDNGPNGWGYKRTGKRYEEFSPFHNITKDDAPNIVFLGSKDKHLPVATAEAFQKSCKTLGVKSDLHIYEGQLHGFFHYRNGNNKYYDLTVAEMDKFFRELGWIK